MTNETKKVYSFNTIRKITREEYAVDKEEIDSKINQWLNREMIELADVPEWYVEEHPDICIKALEIDKKNFTGIPKSVIADYPEIIQKMELNDWKVLYKRGYFNNMPKEVFGDFYKEDPIIDYKLSDVSRLPFDSRRRDRHRLSDEIAEAYPEMVLKIIQTAMDEGRVDLIKYSLDEKTREKLPPRMLELVERADEAVRTINEAKKLLLQAEEEKNRVTNEMLDYKGFVGLMQGGQSDAPEL